LRLGFILTRGNTFMITLFYGWAHKTRLTPPLFIEVYVPSQGITQSIIYMYVRGIYFQFVCGISCF